MNSLRYFLLILLISLISTCSSNEDEDALTKDGPFPISELAGTWDATRAQFSAHNVSVDVVEDGGSARMSVQSNGSFTITINPVDRDAYAVSGEMFWKSGRSHSTLPLPGTITLMIGILTAIILTAQPCR